MAKTNKSTLKKVNVYAKRHINGISYPTMYGLYKGLIMTNKDIKTCLDNDATVHEILKDGSLVKLTKENYDEDNELAHSKKKTISTIKPGHEKTTEEVVEPPVSVGSSFIPKEVEVSESEEGLD